MKKLEIKAVRIYTKPNNKYKVDVEYKNETHIIQQTIDHKEFQDFIICIFIDIQNILKNDSTRNY